MLRQLFSTMALLAMITSCESGPERPLQWVEFQSPARSFRCTLPEGYSTADDVSEHAFGEHKSFSVYWRKPDTWVSDLGLKLLSAGYFEIPELTGLTPDDVLDSFVRLEARMGLAEHGRLLELDTSPVQGFPARRLRAMIDNGKSDSLYLCEQFILSGPRMYQLRTNGYKQNLDTPSMRRFLESFRIQP